MAIEGTEEKAAETFENIKNIIDRNISHQPFSLIIQKIAGISSSSFRNYIQNGNRRGRISLYTCKNLSKFSGIPIDVFAGKEEFTAKHKEKFKKRLKEEFSEEADNDDKIISDFVELMSERIADKVIKKIERRQKNV